MAQNDTKQDLLELYEDIVVNNLNNDNYQNVIKLFMDIVNNKFSLEDFYNDFIILNMINLLEINSSMSSALALILKEVKIKITRYTSLNLPTVKDNFVEIEDNYLKSLEQEIFSNENGIEIHKRYMPYDNGFDLPKYPSTGTIIVAGTLANDPNKEFRQKIIIDHKGRVLKLEGEPEIFDKVVNNDNISYDDIYASLLSQVLEAKEEKKDEI